MATNSSTHWPVSSSGLIKTIPANFTLDELMGYLRDEESPEGFFTLLEWAEHLGVIPERMRKLMVEAKRAGLLETTRMRRERLDGHLLRRFIPGKHYG